MPNSIDSDKTYDHILRIWGVQYNLLQGYRAMFVAINIFLTPYAFNIVFDPVSNKGSSLLLATFGMYLCYLWWRVISLRGLNVFFLEKQLLDYEKEPFVANLTEKLLDWQQRSVKYKLNIFKTDESGIKVASCEGRSLLNQLRYVFTVSWMALFAYSLHHIYTVH